MSSSTSQSAAATAIVAHDPGNTGKPNLRFQHITIKRTTPGPNEVLVRMLATGVCHTDIFVGSCPTGVYGGYPKVMGHEGSGYVLAIGDKVTSVAVGDPVLLSYAYCGSCDLCSDGHVTYCQSFGEENAVAGEKIWDAEGEDGGEIGGKFFGQSSFASLSMVGEKSVVNVKGLLTNGDEDEEELKKFSPLGCGLMTGSGSIINTASAKKSDVIVVTGMGAVGLGAIMAAKVVGCRTIIAVDRVKSRLEIAKELGATYTVDTSPFDITKDDYADEVAKAIKACAKDGKINYAIETTGVLPIINASLRSLSKKGKVIQIGVPVFLPTHVLPVDMIDFFGGTKRFEINYLGDCLAREQLPRMIKWYREGKFPFGRFIRFYPAKDFEQALADMKVETIKPILVH